MLRNPKETRSSDSPHLSRNAIRTLSKATTCFECICRCSWRGQRSSKPNSTGGAAAVFSAPVRRDSKLQRKLSITRSSQSVGAISSIRFCSRNFIQAQIFPYNYQDVIVRGNATRINALFLREYFRQRHSIPELPMPRAFEGGYTDIFFTGVAHNVWHCDIASLYPSVMLQFECFPVTDRLQIFRHLLTDLRNFRLEAKARMRAERDPARQHHLQALQNTFKILLNSFYGYLGFAQGHFADFDAAARVTQIGRDLLKKMIEWLNTRGAQVIEVDTDRKSTR